MRIVFTSDQHGDAALYERIGALLDRERPGLLILGGDQFRDGDEPDPAGSQIADVRNEFLPRVAAWKRDVPGLEVAAIHGNHDWLCVADLLEESNELTVLRADLPKEFGGVRFLGFGLTPPTPFWLKDYERLDCPGDPIPDEGGRVWDATARAARPIGPEHFTSLPTLADELDRIATPSEPWIFVCHAPPHDTALDRLHEVDHPIGSRAVRAFVEARRPLLALHGHVHDSPHVTGAWRDQVGGVECVNPGQGDELHAVIFESDDPRGTLRHTVFA